MTQKNDQAFDFLLNRRSRPAKILTLPVPTDAELHPLLTAAARTPDHGKLEPWRFIVIHRTAMTRLAEAVQARGEELALEPSQINKGRSPFDQGNLAVVVVESPKDSEKIPAIEQTYSAGAVCLALLNAALAAGWGANWLSGWASHDAKFCAAQLGLSPVERIAGIIHIGTEKHAPPERPRPDVEAITTWIDN